MGTLHDSRFDESELIVKEIRVDEGARLKRFRPVSRGRAHPIQKRTAHLTVIVALVEESGIAAEETAVAKAEA